MYHSLKLIDYAIERTVVFESDQPISDTQLFIKFVVGDVSALVLKATVEG